MNELDQVARLLERPELDVRIAAATVLAELKPKSAQLAKALVAALDPEIASLSVPLLRALETARSLRVLDQVFPLTVAKDRAVQSAAVRVLVAYGDEAVGPLQARHASHPDERSGLDRALAELGGKSAFSTLLSGLASENPEHARRAALTVREHTKRATAADKKAYLAELDRFLARIDKEQAKNKLSATAALSARTGALKILGYLEDARAIPTLLAYARDEKADPALRKDAVLALRFCLGAGESKSLPLADLAKVLSAIAAENDALLAQAALHTLGSLPVESSTFVSLAALLLHPDESRARFVAERMADAKNAGSAKALVHALVRADKSRGELLLSALEGNVHAATPLGEALLETQGADTRWLLRSALRPIAKHMPKPIVERMLEAAIGVLEKEGRGHEAFFDVALAAAPAPSAEALRKLSSKLGKKKEHERQRSVLELILRTGHAVAQDRFDAAMLALITNPKEVRPAARGADPSMAHLEGLARSSFDLFAAMKKDKRLTPDDLYVAGFYLAERDLPSGTELLEEVVRVSPRSKIGKAAKNKLSLGA